jgi:hypothetical protein
MKTYLTDDLSYGTDMETARELFFEAFEAVNQISDRNADGPSNKPSPDAAAIAASNIVAGMMTSMAIRYAHAMDRQYGVPKE